VVLENGQIRLSGTGDEVLNNPDIAALYLGGSVRAKMAVSTSEVKENT
jgi:ABC-type lipopolysaccharide export system ATPase subunit